MPLLKPDPSFYPSARLAMEAPPEKHAFVAALNPPGGKLNDALLVVDVEPNSHTYGRRVVEFAARIPSYLKMKVLNEKYLLKRCSNGLVPSCVSNRPKQPYRAPDGKSFFQGRQHDYVDALLSAERVRQDGLFNPLAVESLVEKFRRGRAIGVRDNMGFVGILSAQLVVDQFVRNFGVTSSYAEYRTGIAAVCH